MAEATADLQLREADATAAAKTLDDLAQSGDGTLERQDSLTHARLHVARDRPKVAMQVLDRLESVARRENCDGTLVRILALKAVCLYSMGSRAAAIEVLEKAVALGAPAGLRRAFIDAGPALMTLLKRVRHDASGFVRSLVDARFEGQPVSPKANTLPEALTNMEVTLIQLVDRGLKNQEIAEKLSITVGTTKQYLNRVFGKLQVRNRTEAVARARRLDIL
jgi:LuxR family maltose regulon positive regulatory protein